ncbi:hypothetical protein AMTRI_Chr02g222870 [Amborella trichopoda]
MFLISKLQKNGSLSGRFPAWTKGFSANFLPSHPESSAVSPPVAAQSGPSIFPEDAVACAEVDSNLISVTPYLLRATFFSYAKTIIAVVLGLWRGKAFAFSRCAGGERLRVLAALNRVLLVSVMCYLLTMYPLLYRREAIKGQSQKPKRHFDLLLIDPMVLVDVSSDEQHDQLSPASQG